MEVWIKVEVGEGVRERVGKGGGVPQRVRTSERERGQVRLGEGCGC